MKACQQQLVPILLLVPQNQSQVTIFDPKPPVGFPLKGTPSTSASGASRLRTQRQCPRSRRRSGCSPAPDRFPFPVWLLSKAQRKQRTQSTLIPIHQIKISNHEERKELSHIGCARRTQKNRYSPATTSSFKFNSMKNTSAPGAKETNHLKCLVVLLPWPLPTVTRRAQK